MKKFLHYFWLFIKTLLRLVLKPLSFLPALVVMYMIFSFSSQSGADSSHLSYKVTKELVVIADQVLQKDMSEAQIETAVEKYHHYVRKMAHFTEYMILAISVAFPLYVYGLRGLWLVFFAGAFCVGFACLDEYHQSFVAGRGPSKRDVLIDSSGALLGIYITRIISFIGRKTIFAPLAKKR
ncbi:MAG: VanZ family protein [Lachnospiraceae bacterium]|nr:VanZ family protein [Lachnospiraceae bacterium]